MFPLFTSFLKTATGRTVAGIAVASMSVGGVAAAGASPFTADDDGVTEETVEDPAPIEEVSPPSDDTGDGDEDEDGDDESGDDESGDDDGGDESGGDESGDGESGEDESGDDDGDETELVEDELVEDDAPENHGQVVSEFAQSAESMGFEGCEKGQAVAAVARKDFIPGEGADLEQLKADVAEKCGTDLELVVEDADEPVAEDGEDAEDGDARPGRGNSADHPGQGKGHGKDQSSHKGKDK